ncbi:MAG: deoxycytidylate deaminase [Coriobacteriales bacterium]|jgi:dCMP deaminase
MPDTRPSWDQYFMEITQQVATRSTCLRRQVGAIIVHNKRIIATGYNGGPSGLKHCLEIGCLREQLGIPSGQQHELCRGIHAEQNAIIQAARYGLPIDGSVLYCTTQPCTQCTKMILNAGITEVVYANGYPDELAQQLLDESGIIVRRFEPQI